jgi:NADH dehydrogenase [ubiquinone] 1 alpha subcomplex assembly factor 7
LVCALPEGAGAFDPMNDLAAHIKSIIEDKGPISIAEYMRLCLTGRADSYYMRSDPIGLQGDFVTAPEISQVFGECIGLWCVDMWTKLGSPGAVTLVELGPGRGTLMKDMLRAARVVPAFTNAAAIALVEVSPALREVQAKSLLGDGLPVVRWYDRFQDIGGAGPVIVVANEFFDALPFRQFVKEPDGWACRAVGLNDRGAFSICTLPALDARRFIPSKVQEARVGSIFEQSPDRESVAGEIGAAIHEKGGACLIIDYGFEGPALGDTLQAVKGHAYAELLTAPGEADLTSHVDFTALASAVAANGAWASRVTTQGEFLRQLGAKERTEILWRSANAQQKTQLETALKRLTEADAMGTLFKVLCAVSAEAIQPAGFETQ